MSGLSGTSSIIHGPRCHCKILEARCWVLPSCVLNSWKAAQDCSTYPKHWLMDTISLLSCSWISLPHSFFFRMLRDSYPPAHSFSPKKQSSAELPMRSLTYLNYLESIRNISSIYLYDSRFSGPTACLCFVLAIKHSGPERLPLPTILAIGQTHGLKFCAGPVLQVFTYAWNVKLIKNGNMIRMFKPFAFAE